MERERRPVVGAGEEHLDAEHGDDGADEGNDQRLDVAESPALQEENEQHVESGDEHAVEEGDVEEELEGNGRADDLGQVAGGDGHFSAQPEHKADPGTVVLVAHLGEIALGGHAQLERQALQQDGHEVGGHDDE